MSGGKNAAGLERWKKIRVVQHGFKTPAQRDSCQRCKNGAINRNGEHGKRWVCRKFGSTPVPASAICDLFERGKT